MTKTMKPMTVSIQVAGVAIAVFIGDFFLASAMDGSLLIALLSWAAVGQGIIALAAAADLSGGKWIKEIRPYLLEYYPLLIMFPIVFLIFSRHIGIYSWAAKPGGGGWLSPWFFIIRNSFVLLLPYIGAHLYVRAVKRESLKTNRWAILYLLTFVIGQSFMAFDIVMTFEYPWINTLFGGYFLVEALYGGLAFAAILAAVLLRRKAGRFEKAFNDFTLMLMGFALLWAGLFYSQYLVIWYGNLPEEVSFIARRMAIPLLQNMGIFVILTMFIIPFLFLISRKIKSTYPAVITIAFGIFLGLPVERMIYLLPVAHLSIIGVSFPLVLLGTPFIYLLFKQAYLTIENA